MNLRRARDHVREGESLLYKAEHASTKPEQDSLAALATAHFAAASACTGVDLTDMVSRIKVPIA